MGGGKAAGKIIATGPVGNRWPGNKARGEAVLQNVTGKIEGKPNRTKTAPKQTEKRGQRAGGKRDTRKGSQKVSVFSVGRAAWKLLGGGIGCAGPVPSPWPVAMGRGKARRYIPVSQPRRENGRKERRGPRAEARRG